MQRERIGVGILSASFLWVDVIYVRCVLKHCHLRNKLPIFLHFLN